MIKLLTIFAISLVLAYCSQKEIMVFRFENGKKIDLPLIAMILMLSFFCGLRTHYNDTFTYRKTFTSAPTLSQFFSNGFDPFNYPLFYGLQSIFRHHISLVPNVFFLTNALFSIASILHFLRRHSTNFVFSTILFFSFGLYIFHMAAMKQCLAIAVLTFAVEALIKNKKLIFVLLVLVAMMFHTYAIIAIILIFFTNKPWTFVTYFSITLITLALLTFESTITGLLSYADDVGKSYTADSVLADPGINPFRLAIFAIPPIISFALQEFVQEEYNRKTSIFMNMSILTCLIMCMGIGSSANLFARCSFYFEVGTMIAFPWFLNQVFDKSTERFISTVVSMFYVVFFIISNLNFGSEYRALTLVQFIKDVF